MAEGGSNSDENPCFRIGGCIPSDQPSGQPKFGAVRKYSDKELPPCVDLRQLMTPVENQGDTNACVGNALAAAYEFLIMKNAKKHIDISRLFIYFNGRLFDGLTEDTMIDQGTRIESGIKALTKYGCCRESFFPYDSNKVNKRPSNLCYNEGHRFRIEKAMQIQPTLSEMKACLAEGYPFVFGIETFSSFHKATKGGYVPMPDPMVEKQNAEHGWHAMLAAGYSDSLQCFIVKNSWGSNWGDQGYAYIPYEYMSNSSLCQDLHTIKLVTSDDPIDEEEVHVPISFWKKLFQSESLDLEKVKALILNDKFFWKKDDLLDKITPKPIEKPLKPPEPPIRSRILWIDEKNEGHLYTAKRIHHETTINVDFSENPITAQNYIRKYMKDIKSSTSAANLQIICRGIYRQVNQTSLDLLRFLNEQNLKYVPVYIYTRNVQTAQQHLAHQAPPMGINDWKDRFYVTDNIKDVIKQISKNLSKSSK